MKELIVHLKLMHLYSHAAHLLVARTPFFSDHAFFKDVYEGVFDDLDSVIERSLGLLGEEATPIPAMFLEAANRMAKMPLMGSTENKVFYNQLMMLEVRLCELVKAIAANVSLGTNQLITEICNKSEQRQYKIKQRMK